MDCRGFGQTGCHHDASALTEKLSGAKKGKEVSGNKKKKRTFLPRVCPKQAEAPMEKTAPAEEEAKAPAEDVDFVCHDQQIEMIGVESQLSWDLALGSYN